MGVLWGVVWLGMLSVLLVVFIRQLRRSSGRPWPLVAVGVTIGLAVAGIGFIASRFG